MKDINYDKLETEFNQLNGKEQWEWVLKKQRFKTNHIIKNQYK